MKKVQRDITRAIEGTGVEVIGCTTHKGHLHFMIKLPDGTQHRLSTAGSPAVLESSMRAAARDVRKLFT